MMASYTRARVPSNTTITVGVGREIGDRVRLNDDNLDVVAVFYPVGVAQLDVGRYLKG